MSKSAKLILIAVVGVLLISPLPMYAAEARFFGPIVPEECKCKAEIATDGSLIQTAPDYGCALQTIQNAINFGISLSIIIFTLFLVVTGFSMITSGVSAERVSAAKTRFTNLFIGLVVILCAWLVVDYVMKTLYNNGSFGPWNAILAQKQGTRCIRQTDAVAITTGIVDIFIPGAGTGGSIGGSGSGVRSDQSLTDSQTRAALRSNGINTAPASFAASRTMENTRADTVNQVIEIKRACNCTVQVNATTGGTHSTRGQFTHANGYKVDLQINSGIDSFLKRLQPSGARGRDALYKDSCGNLYAREVGNPGHWDIVVTNGVCRF